MSRYMILESEDEDETPKKSPLITQEIVDRNLFNIASNKLFDDIMQYPKLHGIINLKYHIPGNFINYTSNNLYQNIRTVFSFRSDNNIYWTISSWKYERTESGRFIFFYIVSKSDMNDIARYFTINNILNIQRDNIKYLMKSFVETKSRIFMDEIKNVKNEIFTMMDDLLKQCISNILIFSMYEDAVKYIKSIVNVYIPNYYRMFCSGKMKK